MAGFARRAFHYILPARVKPRRLLWGPASGAVANIDFRYDAAFYFGRHEPDLRHFYEKHMKSGMRCFDVGAFRGWDALTFGHLTNGDVISFEMSSEFIEMAKSFLAPSGLRIELVEARLSDGKDGGTTIDQAASQYFSPDFIKIDVEGAEADVLRGGQATLVASHPALVVEVHSESLELECDKLLRSYGYHPKVVDRSHGIFSEARGSGHNRWLVAARD